MHRKLCPSCGKHSYSADVKGPWSCPKCNHDLTECSLLPLKDVPADEEPETSKFVSVKQQAYVVDTEDFLSEQNA